MVSVSVKELAPDTHGKFHRWVVQVDNQTVENFYFSDHGGRANAYDEAYRYARKLEKAQSMQVRDKTEEWDMREKPAETPDPTDELVRAVNTANAEEDLSRAKSPAHALLLEAADIVDNSRRDSYGSPERSFEKIAAYWSVYLSHPISPADVGRMMELLKIARGNGKDDCLDSAGYAACTWEVSQADPSEDVNIGGTD